MLGSVDSHFVCLCTVMSVCREDMHLCNAAGSARAPEF